MMASKLQRSSQHTESYYRGKAVIERNTLMLLLFS